MEEKQRGESWVRKSSKEEEKSGELLGNREKNRDEGMSQGRNGPWVLRFGEKEKKEKQMRNDEQEVNGTVRENYKKGVANVCFL